MNPRAADTLRTFQNPARPFGGNRPSPDFGVGVDLIRFLNTYTAITSIVVRTMVKASISPFLQHTTLNP